MRKILSVLFLVGVLLVATGFWKLVSGDLFWFFVDFVLGIYCLRFYVEEYVDEYYA